MHHINYYSLNYRVPEWSDSSSVCACFYCYLCVLFLHSTWTKFSGFNYFTVISMPLCIVYLYSIGGLESQGSSFSIQPIAIGYCIRQWMAYPDVQSPVIVAPVAAAVIGSGFPGVVWRHMEVCNRWWLRLDKVRWNPQSRGPLEFYFRTNQC